jgi:hypothetical protein
VAELSREVLREGADYVKVARCGAVRECCYDRHKHMNEHPHGHGDTSSNEGAQGEQHRAHWRVIHGQQGSVGCLMSPST